MGLLDLLRRRRETALQEPPSLRECSERTRVRISGEIVQILPGGGEGPRWAEVVVADGEHHVRLIFMGRREVRGLTVGGHIDVEGMLAMRDGERVIYNPSYTLGRGLSA